MAIRLKRFFKWIAIILLLLLISLFGLYLSAPYWVPQQVSKFLPQNIKLDTLELQRPGLASARIDTLHLTIQSEEPLSIALKDVKLHYNLWQKKLTAIEATSANISIQRNEINNQPFKAIANQIPLPTLPLQTLTIDHVIISGALVQDIEVNDFEVTQDGQSYSLSGSSYFLDHDFHINANATSQNQLLQKLTATIKREQDQVELTISPSPASDYIWQWSSQGKINSYDYFAMEGLSEIDFQLSGLFEQKLLQANIQNLIQIKQNSNISTPVDLQQLQVEQRLGEWFLDNHIKADFSRFNQQAQAVINFDSDTTLYFQSLPNKLLQLAQGQVSIDIQQPSVNAKIQVPQFLLDIEKPLSDPLQVINATIDLQLDNHNVEYLQDTLSGKFASMSNSLQADLSIKDGQAQFQTQQWEINLAPVRLKDKSYLLILPSTQWQAKGQWQIVLEDMKMLQQDIDLQLQKKVKARLNLEKESIDLTNVSFNSKLHLTKKPATISANYSASQLFFENQPLKINQLSGNIQINLQNLVTTGKTQFENLIYPSEQLDLNYISGQTQWKKQGEIFTAQGKLQQSQNTIPFNYRLNLTSDHHQLEIAKSALPVLTVKSWLKFFRKYPKLNISGGNLVINKISGNPIDLLFDGFIQASGVDISFDALKVKNLSIDETLNKQGTFNGFIKGSIEAIEVATGIDITQVTFELQHTLEVFTIRQLNGKLLSGTIEVPRLVIDSTNQLPIAPFTVLLNNIDMNQLLTNLNSESLQIIGRFDLTLPLILGNKYQQIKDGTFKAIGPGTIKLKNEQGKSANIAYQALENFNYKEFSGTLNYDKDGNYLVVLNILGSNPEVYNGFPIKLDLTLRGQLPELLYSMLVTGDMATPIIEDLKQQQTLNIQQ